MTIFSFFSGGDNAKPYGESILSTSQIIKVFDPKEHEGKPIFQSYMRYVHKDYGSAITRRTFVLGDRYISPTTDFLLLVKQQSPTGLVEAGDSFIVQEIGPQARLGMTYIDIKKPIPPGFKLIISFKPNDPTYDDFKRDDREIKYTSPMADRCIWPNNMTDFTLSGLTILVTIAEDKDTKPAENGTEDQTGPIIVPIELFCVGVRQEIADFSYKEDCLCWLPPCATRYPENECLPDTTYDSSGYKNYCPNGASK